jgi:hypothetical protein
MKENMTTNTHEWVTGPDAWHAFIHEHPELGYPPGKWGFHNFLRHYREALMKADAIRLAKRRFWVAHVSRFKAASFECATGKLAQLEDGLGLGSTAAELHRSLT